ncbi:MAG: DUF342 domain-containing protein [Rhodoferax sp.]|nr:DUF342 domain-containing protein [Rhodoferax sp.]MBP9684028.1 DUF342 domain-containing protein [Rhodoferax sp.]
MNFPGISFNEADGQILLLSQPMPDRVVMDSAALHALLLQEGYGQCLLIEDAIAIAASRCNGQQEPFALLVARRCDATVQVQVAADEMTAEISITPPQGGKAASKESVMLALATAGVMFGVDELAVTKACNLGSCDRVLVATGVSFENGCDAVFEELIPQAVDREPKLDENGLIDYREHGEILVVQADAPLMRRIPATQGVDGHTVRGRVLPAQPGHDAHFASPLPGAHVSSDDPNLLKATVSGQPVRVKCGVMVEPILMVDEVNMKTGNIHFDGTVHVKGEVVQNMKVQASGDILVDGMVDGGQLEAGGNILVAGGVIAHAKLRAAGSVTARFAEAAKIYAGTIIMLGDMALECELEALNQIVIGSESPKRGRLIGGTVKVMLLLSVPMLGSVTGGTTTVVMGANSELLEKYEALQKRIEEEKAVEENFEKIIKQLTAVGDPKGLLERVKASKQHALQVWGQSLVERSELDKEIELARTAKVIVGVGVAGSVNLSFGSVMTRLRREFNAGIFSIDREDHILFSDPSGKSVPQIQATFKDTTGIKA